MSVELSCLAWSVILGLVHILAAGNARTFDLGTKWNMGPRDGDSGKLSPLTGRLLRAQSNFFETFPLFAASILMAVLTDNLSTYSYWGAILYLTARIIYLPLYVFGIPVVRSIVWLVSIAGLLMILLPLMF